jgi:hypothetical protein
MPVRFFSLLAGLAEKVWKIQQNAKVFRNFFRVLLLANLDSRRKTFKVRYNPPALGLFHAPRDGAAKWLGIVWDFKATSIAPIILYTGFDTFIA